MGPLGGHEFVAAKLQVDRTAAGCGFGVIIIEDEFGIRSSIMFSIG